MRRVKKKHKGAEIMWESLGVVGDDIAASDFDDELAFKDQSNFPSIDNIAS